jgi:hypothetical protein
MARHQRLRIPEPWRHVYGLRKFWGAPLPSDGRDSVTEIARLPMKRRYDGKTRDVPARPGVRSAELLIEQRGAQPALRERESRHMAAQNDSSAQLESHPAGGEMTFALPISDV